MGVGAGEGGGGGGGPGTSPPPPPPHAVSDNTAAINAAAAARRNSRCSDTSSVGTCGRLTGTSLAGTWVLANPLIESISLNRHRVARASRRDAAATRKTAMLSRTTRPTKPADPHFKGRRRTPV